MKITEATPSEEGAPHCKVSGVIGKEIKFEVLLPDQWNKRLVMSGGGGFSGFIENNLRYLTAEGYVTTGTNTGHEAHPLKADWALNNMERQVNFGHLAIHRTAEVAKAVTRAFYCEGALYNYFMGCSRGGGQALIEAQRYPEDFDGIVAMAPILDWPATGVEMVQNIKALYPDPQNLSQPLLAFNHIKLLEDEVLKQCDELDGLRDQILNDPSACDFDFSQLPSCDQGMSTDQCFTEAQIELIKTIYKGVSINGKRVYPGFPFGAENARGSWLGWIVGGNKPRALDFPSLHFAFGTEMFKYLVFNDPDWDYTTYDFSNFFDDTEYASSYLNATSTDYSAFKERGGKLILPHGWNDPALSAFTSIEHYEAVKKKDSEITDFFRMYLLPGMLHCGGGPGPSETDWISLIRNWVEKGEAPERVVVSKIQDGELIMTRPIFPYPKKAVYKGSGNSNDANNFESSKN